MKRCVEAESAKEISINTPDREAERETRHDAKRSPLRLLWASAINVGFAILECVGGIIANSLSLISDAVHNLADASSTVVAFLANRASRKPPTAKYTFGFHRFEILAALCNAVVLMAIYGFIFIKAFGRLHSHTQVDSQLMLLIACVGMLAKLSAMLILHRPAHGNLNVRAAYMHLLADLLSSLTVILGSLAIHFWQIDWIDSLITLCVGCYILLHTWPILRECLNILMQAAPRGMSTDAIVHCIETHDGINAVAQPHLWQLAEDAIYFSARVSLRPSLSLDKAIALLAQAETRIKQRFNIQHVSLTLETSTPSTPQKGIGRHG